MRQLALSLPNTWGGRRPGAGRKRLAPRPNVSHRTRPYHDAAHPAHVTLRVRAGLPGLRGMRAFHALRDAIRLAQREHFRICHFSIQSNHVHLLVEATHRDALIRGVQGMTIRMARSVNRALRRQGKVWGDRYHRRDLATPREVRNALVYVLNNVTRHRPEFSGPDPCSSAAWVRTWRADAPVARPRTWLLRIGWTRTATNESTRPPGKRKGLTPSGKA